MKNKDKTPEEGQKLKELLQKENYSKEQIDKLVDHKANQSRVIPSEWEGLMENYGGNKSE